MQIIQNIDQVRRILNQVLDPEVPALTIADLGILRGVEENNGTFLITITPTFTGCPAMRAIEDEIGAVLNAEGVTNFKVRTVLSPAWTTDWMTEDGKRKLKEYGIAPPSMSTEEHLKAMITGLRKPVQCPFCNSQNTRLTSAFGSTACKALHYCDECKQPFEEFKCH
jgi:ring-1,2-phenylacetyl-CoA epoxidase subunit PaaD